MNITKLITILIFLTAALLLKLSPASAACGSIPYAPINGITIADANQYNANNNFLKGCATSVDNSQIGQSGIYASQIIPNSTSAATFGGSYGYRFDVPVGNQTPLQLFAGPSPTTDIFDVYNNLGTTNYFWVDKNGEVQAPNLTSNSVIVTNLSGTNITGATVSAGNLTANNITTHNILGNYTQTGTISGNWSTDGTPSFFAAPNFFDTHADASCNGELGWFADNTVTVNTVSAKALGLHCKNSDIFALDNAGNIGTIGTINAGSFTSTAADTNPFLQWNTGANKVVLAANSTANVVGVSTDAMGMAQLNSSGGFIKWLLAIDTNGNLGLTSDVAAAHGVFSLYTVSHGYGVPYDAQSGGSTTTHIEHGRENITSPSGAGCTAGAPMMFHVPFSATPDVTVTGQMNVNIMATWGGASATSFTPALCTLPGGTGPVTSTVFWTAIGE